MQIPPTMPIFIPQVNPISPANIPADAGALSTAEALAPGECAACNNRYYQDDSTDGGVSFQQPTRIHPNEAASAVIGHEREHLARDARFAREDGREVVSSEMRIFTSVCPDCGRVYVSGGEARTVTRGSDNGDEQPMSIPEVFASRGE